MNTVTSGKLFFLVNSREREDLQDKSLILLFGTNDYLRERVLAIFPDLIRESETLLTVRSDDSVLEFYYGGEEVIERFVLVDVLFSDEPDIILGKLCLRNGWHLFDLDAERYIDV